MKPILQVLKKRGFEFPYKHGTMRDRLKPYLNTGLLKLNQEGQLLFRTKSQTTKGKWWFQRISFRDFVKMRDALRKRNRTDAQIMKEVIFGRMRVNCNCPAFLFYGLKFIAWQNDPKFGLDPEKRAPRVRNPQQKGSLCFVAGSRVLMADGKYKPIEQIRTGDVVYTHTGDLGEVTQTMSRSADHFCSIRVDGVYSPIVCTDDHPFLVQGETEKKVTKKGKKNKAATLPEGWIPAKELQPGYMATLPQLELLQDCPLDDGLMFFIGMILSGGMYPWDKAEYKLTTGDLSGISQGFRDLIVAKARKAGLSVGIKPGWRGNDMTSFEFSSRTLLDVFNFYILFYHSRVTDINSLLSAISSYDRREMLLGMIAGSRWNSYCYEYILESPDPRIHDMAKVICQTLGVAHREYSSTSLSVDMFSEVFTDNEKRLIDCRFGSHFQRAGSTPAEFTRKIISVDRFTEKKLPVFNIEVSGDNSYLVEGIAAHNCKHLMSVIVVLPTYINYLVRAYRKLGLL